MSLITLWINNGNIKSKIILDSGSSSQFFNNSRYFDCLDHGDFNVVRTGKEHADLPIKGMGQVVLQWGEKKIALEGCLYVPDIIVVNLISPGILDGKSCSVIAKGGKFSVVKDGIDLFGGKISNNMYSVRNPDKVGSNVNYSLFNASIEPLRNMKNLVTLHCNVLIRSSIKESLLKKLILNASLKDLEATLQARISTNFKSI
jgi:hypothetical protein